jgi:hypothetical protein
MVQFAEIGGAVAVYADGSVVLSNPSSIGGTWAWLAVSESGRPVAKGSGFFDCAEFRPPLPRQVGNNAAEFMAVLQALEALPEGWSGRICSDSQVTLLRFFAGARMEAGIPPAWAYRAKLARERLGVIQPVRMDGHPTRKELLAGVGRRGGPVSIHQKWCDKECTRLARNRVPLRAR